MRSLHMHIRMPICICRLAHGCLCQYAYWHAHVASWGHAHMHIGTIFCWDAKGSSRNCIVLLSACPSFPHATPATSCRLSPSIPQPQARRQQQLDSLHKAAPFIVYRLVVFTSTTPQRLCLSAMNGSVLLIALLSPGGIFLSLPS